jgi:hypothetical protein
MPGALPEPTGGPTVAEEPTYAPDQLKPSNHKWARIAGIVSIVALLAMTRPFNNHTGATDDVFLLLTAGIIAVLLIGDTALRRNGLRP